MPRRYRKYNKSNKRYHKRNYRFKRRFKKDISRSIITTQDYGFPDTYKTKLKINVYAHLVATGTTNNWVYRANSLFDPEYAMGGNQPRYYDQLSAIYNKYLVLSCKAKVEFSNQSTTVPCTVALMYSDSDPSALTMDDIIENRYSKYTTIGTASGTGNKRLSYYMPMKSLLGQNSLNPDPYLYTSVGSNPVDEVYFMVSGQSVDASSQCNVYAIIELTYYCLFKGTKLVDQS